MNANRQQQPKIEWGFYAVVPRIVRTQYKNLTHAEKWLYTCLRDLCGRKGTCFRTLRALSEETDISIASLSSMIPHLQHEGLIHAEKKRRKESGKEIWHISIVDIWQANAAYSSSQLSSSEPTDCSNSEQSPEQPPEIVQILNNREGDCSNSEGDCSNSEGDCSNFPYRRRSMKKEYEEDIPSPTVSTPEPLTTSVVALPFFSSQDEPSLTEKPKSKSVRAEAQDDEAQERRRGIYQRIVARRGYEIDGKARISEYAAIKQLAEKYTDEQIEAIHRYLFETDWRWSKMDNQYKIGACVIAAEAQSVLQILKTKTPSSPAVSAPPIPPKPMKSRLVQDLDEKRERYARKKG